MSVRTVTYTQCDCCKKTDMDNDIELFEEFDNIHVCKECFDNDWVILSDYDINYERKEKKTLPGWFFIRWDEKDEDYDFSRIIPIPVSQKKKVVN